MATNKLQVRRRPGVGEVIFNRPHRHNAFTSAMYDAAFQDSVWGKKYPHAVATWDAAWERFIPFLAFPPELRRVIYTT